MSNDLMGSASARGALLALWMSGSVLLSSAAGAADGTPVREERWDEAAAKAQAARLLPIIADEVIDGRRQVMGTLPAWTDTGLIYRFRLRPQPVPYRPLCEMRTVSLTFQFARGFSGGSISVDEFDLLAMRRAGDFSYQDLSVRRQYRELSPPPATDAEHATRCVALDLDHGWIDASEPSEIHRANYWLTSLRGALANRRGTVRLRCLRNRVDCPISASTILDIVEPERRQFETISLHDGTAWAQFFYSDEPAPNADAETRTLIIESRLGEIVSVTLVYGIMARVVI